MARVNTLPDASARHPSVNRVLAGIVPLRPLDPRSGNPATPPFQLSCLGLAPKSNPQSAFTDPAVVQYLLSTSEYSAHMSLPPHVIIQVAGPWSFVYCTADSFQSFLKILSFSRVVPSNIRITATPLPTSASQPPRNMAMNVAKRLQR